MNPTWLRVLAFAVVAVVSPLSAQSREQTRPNVVLIMTDDAGYGDLGIYGASDIRTPHLDNLARDGVRLTDFYANGATCTPTRAALISGRYQQRFLLEAALGAGPADRERGLPPTGFSLPALLRNSGYATGLIGKWHLGWEEQYSPKAHGFDYFFGFKSGSLDYYRHTNEAGAADLFENDSAVDVTGYMTDLITDRTISFMERQGNKPFFVDVAYNAPHWPFQRPDEPLVPAKNFHPFTAPPSTRADYVAMVERVDEGVGRILATLDRLGLRENTLVIFSNDNGGEWLSSGGPLFHRKGTVWEGGIRVPAIVRWPGRIPAGTVTSQAGMTMDLTTTILAATSTTVPPAARLEGIDLLPVLEGRTPVIERTLFWRVVGAGSQAAIRSGNWKLVLDAGRPMLFDLATDISEHESLIGQHPEVARRLGMLLGEWQQDVDAEEKGSTPR